jgi:hypothetical protein
MPETVTLTVPATKVVRGDAIVGAEDAPISGRSIVNRGELVTWITRGSKNITFETAAGRIVVAETTVVSVTREQATAEETAAAERAYAIRGLRRLVADFQADPTTKLRATLESFDPATSYGAPVSYSALDGFLAAQAKFTVGAAIRETLKRVATWERHADEDEDQQLVSAVAIFTRRAQRRSHIQNPLSRSTSVTSNLLEDLDAWAVAEFNEKLIWTGAASIVAARADELERQTA